MMFSDDWGVSWEELEEMATPELMELEI